MAKFILGKKLEMTRVYNEAGLAVPVTKVAVEPCFVLQVKTKKRDGYSAIQVGQGERRNSNKPLSGHLKGTNARNLKEFLIDEKEEDKFHVGDVLRIENFTVGEKVRVSGISKGKGFQGVVKRHGFSGSPASHGHKDQLRMPGSIGATGPSHVFKGMRMPGRMGGKQVTVSNLEIIKLDGGENAVYVKGAIPGSVNSVVFLRGHEGEMVPEKSGKKEDTEEKAADAAEAKEANPVKKGTTEITASKSESESGNGGNEIATDKNEEKK